MRWLQSVGEVEVPDAFLPELLKKMEERKTIVPDKKPTERGFNFPLSLKLPVQAVAMVAIVFLVLYLTKMIRWTSIARKRQTNIFSFRTGKT
jgi:hypothetical protein